jgi:subtilase family serine protease
MRRQSFDRIPGAFESLEQRTMLALPAGSGLTPAQVKHAYGWDQIAGTGAGQTIAIVVPFDNPDIRTDLTAFDTQFGIAAPPSFTIVNQTGGSRLPPADTFGTAAQETALDVEWAHAMAPQASILLVEAKVEQLGAAGGGGGGGGGGTFYTPDLRDLLVAVDYARSQDGVSVVSMSWGFPETSAQILQDQHFTTPPGHLPITFVAASGDTTGAPVQYPASSPRVLSVGGTSLTLSGGNYGSEVSWDDGSGNGSTGGTSGYEAVPFYQAPLNTLSKLDISFRGVPDVAYNADPNNNAYAVFDAFTTGDAVNGWIPGGVGGTSAGAPQWAALVALANQQRLNLGQATLDGYSQTLPALYSVYAAPGTPGYATYTATFHDIDDMATPGFFGPTNPAVPGWDKATGLGTPHVAQVVQLLANAGTFDTTGPGNPAAPTIQVPGPFVVGTVKGSFPITVAPGDHKSLKVKLTNITNGLYFNGPVTINVFAATTPTLPANSTPFFTTTIKKVKLAAGRSKNVKVQFDFPNYFPAGDYFFFVTTDTSAVSTPVPAS